MEPDGRIRWIESRVVSSLRPRPDDVKHMLNAEESRSLLLEFFTSETWKRLVVYSDGERLVATTNLPAHLPHKGVIFLKVRDVAITDDNINEEVQSCDLVPQSLLELHTLAHHVYLPMLSNPDNQRGWEADAPKIIDSCQKFAAAAYVALGQTKGETLLPMPPPGILQYFDGPGANAAGDKPKSVKEKDRIHVLESTVVTWTKLIKHVLKSDAESLGKGGQNPGPMALVNCWQYKCTNLSSLSEQIRSEPIQSILRTLDAMKNTYAPAFLRVAKDIAQAQQQARSVVTYLVALVPWFEKLSGEDEVPFESLADIFPPLMHTVYLVWINCKHYSSQGRLSQLFRLISNDIIARTRAYVDGRNVLSLPMSEAHAILKTALRVCATFRGSYHDQKLLADEYLERLAEQDRSEQMGAGIPGGPMPVDAGQADKKDRPASWPSRGSPAFQRLNGFIDRLHDLMDFAQTATHFSRLDGLELGGPSGKALDALMGGLHSEYLRQHEMVLPAVRSVDPLDVDAENSRRVDECFHRFRTGVKDLERRLAVVVRGAFESCGTWAGWMRLLDVFEGLVGRDVMQQMLEDRFVLIMRAYRAEIHAVRRELHEYSGKAPPAHPQMPPISRTLRWLRGLKERVEAPSSRMRLLSKAVIESEEGKDVLTELSSLLAEFERAEAEQQTRWVHAADGISQQRLKVPLLVREEVAESTPAADGEAEHAEQQSRARIRVNFDQELVVLMNEVRHLAAMGVHIPENVLAMHRKWDPIHGMMSSLEMVCDVYNWMQESLLPVERPLFRRQMDEIAVLLQRGLEELTWKSYGIQEFINDAQMLIVNDVHKVMSTIRSSYVRIQQIVAAWKAGAGGLFARRDPGKTYPVAKFAEEHRAFTAIHNYEISESGVQIHELLQSINAALGISSGAPAWKVYVEHVQSMILEGLADAATAALSLMLDALEPPLSTTPSTPGLLGPSTREPLLEIKLELVAPVVISNPPLDASAGRSSLKDTVMEWVEGCVGIARLVSRVDAHTGDYFADTSSCEKVAELVSRISRAVDENNTRCRAFQDSFASGFSFLWTTDINASFADFMTGGGRKGPKSAPRPTSGLQRERSQMAVNAPPSLVGTHVSSSEGSSQQFTPTLEEFDARMAEYKAIGDNVAELPSMCTVGWVRVNAKPIKQALATSCTKWIFSFTKHLMDGVVASIDSTEQFIARMESGVDERVPDGDVAAFLRVMGFIREFRSRMETIDRSFGPIHRTIGVLRKYGYLLPDDRFAAYKESPARWAALKRKVLAAKERLAPRMQLEAERMSKDLYKFSDATQRFRERFLKDAPFGREWTVDDAVRAIARFSDAVTRMRRESRELMELQELLDSTVNNFADLGACAEDLRLLAIVWDVAKKVRAELEQWHAMTWTGVDISAMVESANDMAGLVQQLPAPCVEWDVVRDMVDRVMALRDVAPLVEHLRCDSLRDRHWKQLQRATGIKIQTGDLVGDLLSRGLGGFEAVVVEAVTRARKELAIERTIKEFEDTWLSKTLDFHRSQSLHDASSEYGGGSSLPGGSRRVDDSRGELRARKGGKGDHGRMARTVPESDELYVLSDPGGLFDTLESHLVTLQGVRANRYLPSFADEVAKWEKRLQTLEVALRTWMSVQEEWVQLEDTFLGTSEMSEELRASLPQDAVLFGSIDREWKDLMRMAYRKPNMIELCCREGFVHSLAQMHQGLEHCKRSLKRHLDRKRSAFPRFYFVSAEDILRIVCHGPVPAEINPFLPSLFGNVSSIRFDTAEHAQQMSQGGQGAAISRVALGLYSSEGELLKLSSPLQCVGRVELWLAALSQGMRDAVRAAVADAVRSRPAESSALLKWVSEKISQAAVVGTAVHVTSAVEKAFRVMADGGSRDAMSACLAEVRQSIGELSAGLASDDMPTLQRSKTRALGLVLCHARDVIGDLVASDEKGAECFRWQSQLRYALQDEGETVSASLCGETIAYGNEYLGCADRLVLCPASERCRVGIILAHAANAAAAVVGRATSGKTQTVKDLGHALGAPVYSLGCSAGTDYRAIVEMYRGMACTGAWVCIDGIDSVGVSVLSAASTVIRAVLDAARSRAESFSFFGEELRLVPGGCCVATVNSRGFMDGLPACSRSLFRPVACTPPPLEVVAEALLLVSGFGEESALIARRLAVFYDLCRRTFRASPDGLDWSLSAVRGVLAAASLRRRAGDKGEKESGSCIVAAAAKQYHLPALTAQEAALFASILSDCFPGSDDRVGAVPGDGGQLEQALREAAAELGLIPKPSFVQRALELDRLLNTRHAVYVVGPPGCGKTSLLRMLALANAKVGRPTISRTLHPKALDARDFLGYVHPDTREWTDGVLSAMLRRIADERRSNACEVRWVVLDADVDSSWTDSLASAMGPERALFLASHERIPIRADTRIIVESDTVRAEDAECMAHAAVLRMSADDVGWAIVAASWIDAFPDAAQADVLRPLMWEYVPRALQFLREHFASTPFVVPTSEMTIVTTLCTLLTALMPELCPKGSSAASVTSVFVYASIWAFGGLLSDEPQRAADGEVPRAAFSAWMRSTFASIVKIPDNAECWDWHVLPGTPGLSVISSTAVFASGSGPFGADVFIPTAGTERMGVLLNALVAAGKPVMFVGVAGTGKTSFIRERLRAYCAGDDVLSSTLTVNAFTTARSLQTSLEQSFEKNPARTHGVPDNKALVVLIDDLHMAAEDERGCRSVDALLRQHIDQGGFYDYEARAFREVRHVRYVFGLNMHKGAAYRTSPRLQRQVAAFYVPYPGADELHTMFSAVLAGYGSESGSGMATGEMADRLVRATVELQARVRAAFPPTRERPHYVFTLRDLGIVIRGLCFCRPAHCDAIDDVRLWLHECHRVYGDRLASASDMSVFQHILHETARKYFYDFDQVALFARPLLFTCLASAPASMLASTSGGREEARFQAIANYDHLRLVITDRLAEYNAETGRHMDLVLLDEVLEQLCRLIRVFRFPGDSGNMVLVGVGGAGKQSLTRLAAHMCGFKTHQLPAGARFGLAEFRAELVSLYIRTGLRGDRIAFLVSESQLAEEGFLVYINDFLASGIIADLFSAEEKNDILVAIRAEVKHAGLLYKRDVAWDYFIAKVRRNLRFVISMSPGPERFAQRCKMYPSLVSATSVIFCQPWSKQSLISMAHHHLGDADVGGAEMRENVAHLMASMHLSVSDATDATDPLAVNEYNLANHRSYLDFIGRFVHAMAKRREGIRSMQTRLEGALARISTITAGVAKMRAQVDQERSLTLEKKLGTEKLLAQIGQDLALVEDQKALAVLEEGRLSQLEAEAAQHSAAYDTEIAAADAYAHAADAALARVDRNHLAELRTIQKPPHEVAELLAAFVLLTSPGKGATADLSWAGARKALTNADRFIDAMVKFDRKVIPEQNIAAVMPYVERAAEAIAAGNTMDGTEELACKPTILALREWIVNVVGYNGLYVRAAPVLQRLTNARDALDAVKSKVAAIHAKVGELESRIKGLAVSFEGASSEKRLQSRQLEKTNEQLAGAERFLQVLAGESAKWQARLDELRARETTLIGDLVAGVAYVTYLPAIRQSARHRIVRERWIPDLIERGIPCRLCQAPDTITDVHMEELVGALIHLATSAAESDEGGVAGNDSPSHLHSRKPSATRAEKGCALAAENMALLKTCRRWPMLVDPHGHGVDYIRRKEASAGLFVVDASSGPADPSILETAVTLGKPLLVENVGSTLDRVLLSLVTQTYPPRSGDDSPDSTPVVVAGVELERAKGFRVYLCTRVGDPQFGQEILSVTSLVDCRASPVAFERWLLEHVFELENAQQSARLVEIENQRAVHEERLAETEERLLVHGLGDDSKESGNVGQSRANLVSSPSRKVLRQGQSVAAAVAAVAAHGRLSIVEDFRSGGGLAPTAMLEIEATIGEEDEEAASVHDRISSAVVMKQVETESLDSLLAEQGGIIRMREHYRPVAQRCATLYFAVDALDALGPTYACTLDSVVSATDEAVRSVPAAAAPAPKEGESAQDAADAAVDARVSQLVNAATLAVFRRAALGLAESDRLLFAVHLACVCGREASHPENIAFGIDLPLLLHGPRAPPMLAVPPMPKDFAEWLTADVWTDLFLLSTIPRHSAIVRSVRERPAAWRDWRLSSRPEEKPTPIESPEGGASTPVSPLHRALIIKYLRPDRLVAALSALVSRRLGPDFVAPAPAPSLPASCDASTPVLILCPSDSDCTKLIESLAAGRTPTRISLGNGRVDAADAAIDGGSGRGECILVDALHVCPQFATSLEKRVQAWRSVPPNPRFRLFLTADPARLTDAVAHALASISVVISGDPARSLRRALVAALAVFDSQQFEGAFSSSQRLMRIAIGLATMHALLRTRRRFGRQGLSDECPLSDSDLVAAARFVLSMPSDGRWSDLRGAICDVVYAGHFSDEWDLNVCRSYAELYLREEIMRSDWQPLPHLPVPTGDTATLAQFAKAVEDVLPADDVAACWGLPQSAGLRAGRSIGARILAHLVSLSEGQGSHASPIARQSSFIRPMTGSVARQWGRIARPPAPAPPTQPQPQASAGAGDAAVPSGHNDPSKSLPLERIRSLVDATLERLPDAATVRTDRPVVARPPPRAPSPKQPATPLSPAVSKAATSGTSSPSRPPPSHETRRHKRSSVAQALNRECERMVRVLSVARSSLETLDACLVGSVPMHHSARVLLDALAAEHTPAEWLAAAGMSARERVSLGAWMDGLVRRHALLQFWATSHALPRVLPLPELFDVPAFLCAYMQDQARAMAVSVEEVELRVEVTEKHSPQELRGVSASHGIFATGLYLDGARYEDGRLREQTSMDRPQLLPYVRISVALRDKEARGASKRPDVFECPVYTTRGRAHKVLSVALKTESVPSYTWTLAGAAILLCVE